MADHVDVAGYVLGTLAPAEAAAFETHLATCDRCRAELAELDALPNLLAGAELAPPPQLRQRTLDAVRRAAGPSAAPVAPVSPPLRGPSPLRPGTPPLPSDQPPPPAPWTGRSSQQQPGPGQPLEPVRSLGTGPAPAGSRDTPQPARSSDGVVTPFRSRRQAAARWIGAAAAALMLVAAVGATAPPSRSWPPTSAPAAAPPSSARWGRAARFA
jgi:anti-sigma factor RsiW